MKRKGPEKAPADVTLGDHAAGIEYPKSAGLVMESSQLDMV